MKLVFTGLPDENCMEMIIQWWVTIEGLLYFIVTMLSVYVANWI